MTRPEPLVDPGTPRTTLPPVPRWRIAAYVTTGVVLTAAVVTVLWWAGTRGLTGKDLVTARLDALRVGLSIAVGGGGVFAVYLAWRRQRATEVDLDNRERALAHQLAVAADTKTHQERVAAATEKDAEARRITDLYTKAAELLGAESAAVRLAGMYALERLAQDNPEQRETIVAVWCAYLRMPFTPPEDDGEATPAQREEREVRLAVQRLLSRHLRPRDDADNPSDRFWAGMSVDLTGATLITFDFHRCEVAFAQFRAATFHGPAVFREATFTGTAGFSRATFRDDAFFQRVTFHSNATFRRTTFGQGALFTGAAFGRHANFEAASFDGPAGFESATFTDGPVFRDTTFRYGDGPSPS